jgi:copper(I)-binding protein
MLGSAAIAFAAALTLPATAAQTIAITDAWSRPATQTGGVFLTIANSGAADRLLHATSNAAAHVELHESVKVMPAGMTGASADANSMAGAGTATTMRRVRSIAIAANATTVLKPGGYHVMLIGLEHPLKAGDRLRLQLTFAHAGTISTTATVRPM